MAATVEPEVPEETAAGRETEALGVSAAAVANPGPAGRVESIRRTTAGTESVSPSKPATMGTDETTTDARATA